MGTVLDGSASPIAAFYRQLQQAESGDRRWRIGPDSAWQEGPESYAVVYSLQGKGNAPFFIGSGSLAHIFHQFERAHNGAGLESGDTPLYRRIREEWARGYKVTVILHFFYTDRKAAYEREAELVAEIGRTFPLLNNSDAVRYRKYRRRPATVVAEEKARKRREAAETLTDADYHKQYDYHLWRLIIGNRTVFVGLSRLDDIKKHQDLIFAARQTYADNIPDYPRGYDYNREALKQRYAFLWKLLCLGQHLYFKHAAVQIDATAASRQELEAAYRDAITAHYSPYLANQAHAKTFIQRARDGELLSHDQPLDFDTAS